MDASMEDEADGWMDDEDVAMTGDCDGQSGGPTPCCPGCSRPENPGFDHRWWQEHC